MEVFSNVKRILLLFVIFSWLQIVWGSSSSSLRSSSRSSSSSSSSDSSSDDSSDSSSDDSSDSSSDDSSSSSSSSSSDSSSNDSSSDSSFIRRSCSDPNEMTIIYDLTYTSDYYYQKIIETNNRASFAVEMSEIRRYKSIGNVSLVVKIDDETIHKLSEFKKGKLLRKEVKKISKNILRTSRKKFNHVILPPRTSKRIVRAFVQNEIKVISPKRIVTKHNSAKLSKAKGIIFIAPCMSSSHSQVKSFLKRIIQTPPRKPISLSKCISGADADSDSSNSDSSVAKKVPRVKIRKIPVLRSCIYSYNIFTLIYKGGLNHFHNIMLHDQSSAFIVTVDDIFNREFLVQRIIENRRKLIISFSEENLVDTETASSILDILTSFFASIDSQLEYIMMPPSVPDLVRNLFATKLRHVREVEVSSRFSADTFREPSYNFSNFVLVDLEGAESPANILRSLEIKMENQDNLYLPWEECVGTNRKMPLFNPTLYSQSESVKRGRLYGLLNERRPSEVDVLDMSISRTNIFEDSFRNFREFRSDKLATAFIRVKFLNEEGIDGGGLAREWFTLITRELFNSNYALFIPSETNQDIFHPNPNSAVNSQHLNYFKFVGQFVAKAVIDKTPIACNFSRGFFKLILGRTPNLFDIHEIDLELYKSLTWITENSLEGTMDELSFTSGTNYFGQHHDIELIENGANILVDDANKFEYIRSIIHYKFYGSCRDQINSFLEGFYSLIPHEAIAAFTIEELKHLISGASEIDVNDWESNTRYCVYYNSRKNVIRMFWEAVRSFTPLERRKLLRFATGSSGVPIEGFSHLSNRGNLSPFKIYRTVDSLDSLPKSHTCFNRIDLPEYKDYQTLRAKLLLAINEGNDAFLFG